MLGHAYDIRYEWWQRRKVVGRGVCELAGGGGIETRFGVAPTVAAACNRTRHL